MALTAQLAAKFIKEILNDPSIPVILQKQDKASPPKPYAAYRILSNQPLGVSAVYHDINGENVEETVERKRIKSLEVQFFTQTEQQAIDQTIENYISANDLAELFEDKIDLTRSTAYQKLNGFSVLGVQTITDIDEQLGDRWERRALCELRIHDTTFFTETVESYDPNNLTSELNIKGL